MTKLDTLKGMLRRWKLTHSTVDAADVCEFLVENLDIHHKIDTDAVNETIDKIRDSIPEPSTMEEYHS